VKSPLRETLMPASVTTIASFPTSAGNGTDPDGQLFIDSNGDLFGATVHGGVANGSIGTTYEIRKIGGSFAPTPTYLADIPTGLNTLAGPNGSVPNLSADANGDLFGLMLTGGANTLGAVVEFPVGGGTVNLPTTFSPGTGPSKASHPGGRLLVDASGNLFGTTLSGGTNNAGTVFEIQKTGGVYASAPTVLTSFNSGIVPSGSGNLVEDAAGDLFGTTTSSVFEVKKTGATYATPVDLAPFPVGTQIGTLTIDPNGDIFGTTISGGANNVGTVFEIVKNTSTATTLASFSLADGQISLNHAKNLIVDSNGNLFGTTDPSSQNSGGVVFEIVRTPTGYESTPTIVVNFNGLATAGLGANLVDDANGNLFGTTQTGGANGSGTVFEITNSGFVVAPVVTAGASISYLAGAAAVALDPGLSVSDVKSANLTQATVTISAGFHAGDTLSVGSAPGITSSYNAGAGVLTLSGPATQAAYQAALDSVMFASASTSNPSNRTITWSINDGIATSVPATSSVGVFANNSSLDIRLQNTSGRLALWQVSGAALAASSLVGTNFSANWFEEGTGAFFSGDTSDILWQNTSGAIAVWQEQGATLVSSNSVLNPGPSWHIKGTGDFYGDGHTDVLLQNDSGQAALWDMTGATISQSNLLPINPGPTWHIEGTGDFYGDGNTDIVWQNDNGSVALWDMTGATIKQSGVVSINPGPAWHVVGTGDFYGDGKTDILLQNDNGTVGVWEMNGATISKSSIVYDPGPTWHVTGTGDFNQDGKTDITLQNDNGTVAVWNISDAKIASSGVVYNPGPAWSVTGENTMRFIQSASAGEILGATPTTPEEFVFTNSAAGVHTITGFNPVQDRIELPLAQFDSFAAVQGATFAIAGGAEINLGHGSSLLLPGVNPTVLHASNFALT
jgi:uncharacterized repeat protein (TIGR03803 family)